MQEIGHTWKRNRLSNLNLNETNFKKPVSNNGGEQGLPNQRSLPGHSSAGRAVTAAAVCVRCGARFHVKFTSTTPVGRGSGCQRAGTSAGTVVAVSRHPRSQGRSHAGPRAPASTAGPESESAAGPPGRPAIPCQCQSDCQRGRDADSTAGRFRLWAPLSRRDQLTPLRRSFVVLFLLLSGPEGPEPALGRLS